ncbi:Uncharacterised protein [Yersinia intermedia]|uniref:STY1053 family phage-associated protein n=1 Tax=Yersinia intermedia TaxID=631 RepID=UPI0005E8AEF1|nr:hypothetical protein [Yersinia intermedia]CNH59018.1 Uncharacterised protein [Yersinia intermedia]
MKYIVSGHSVLNLADGSNYTLTPGIHDGFSDEVKKHWAFSAYAKPLDESDLAKEVENLDLVARVKLLDDEITSLKAQVLSLTVSESASGDGDEATAEAVKESANAKKQSTANK